MSPPSPTPPPASEAQRHEFILHYYDMAVRDLERHLGIGWQTLGVLAGAVVALSLAEKKELPAAIAVATAVAISSWGLLNVIDSNYWAVRAIAFLANVESVYFGVADRKRFNPYVGAHPPFKLMNSLQYQGYIAGCFVAISLLYYFYRAMRVAGWSISGALVIKTSMPFWNRVFWSIPVLVALAFVALICRAYARRLGNYRDFVRDSPGSGLFEPLTEPAAAAKAGHVSGADLQRDLLASLDRQVVRWTKIAKYATWGAAGTVGLLLILVFV